MNIALTFILPPKVQNKPSRISRWGDFRKRRISMANVKSGALITEQKIKELKDKRLTSVQAKKIRHKMMVKNAAIGAGIGLSSLLTGKVKARFAIAAGLVLGAVGAGYAVYVDKDYIDDGTIKDLKDEVVDFAKENLNAAKESSNILFSTHVDDFHQEHSIYDAAYDLEKTREDNAATEGFRVEKDKALEKLSAEIGKLDKEYASVCSKEEEFLKENPNHVHTNEDESNVSFDSVPVYGKPNDFSKLIERKKFLYTNIESLREEYKVIKRDLDIAVKQSTEEQKIIEDAEDRFNRAVAGLKKTLCNRVARDHYYKMFVEPMETILKEAQTFSTEVDSYSEEIAYEKRLKEFLKLIAIVGKDHESVGKQYEALMKQKLKLSGLTRSKIDMTYATAPYHEIFEIYVDPSQIDDDKLHDYIEDIKTGAKDDVFIYGQQKGRWLVERNFSRSWMFTLGDFSEHDASRLEYLLEGYIDFRIDYNVDIEEVNKAYRTYARDHHEDVGYNDGSFQETSALMKKLRAYIKSQDEYLKKEGPNGNT